MSRMVIDREVFLVLATAIAACQPVARAPAVASPAAFELPVATVPDDDGPPAPPVTCSAIARQNETRLANPTEACTTVGIEPVDVVRKRLREAAHGGLLDYCHEGQGRWAVLVVSAALGESTGESGIACRSEVTYQLVFVSAGGERVVSTTRTLAASIDDTIDATIQEVFDFDGDGRDELVLEERRWGNGGGSSTSLEVLRPARAIEPYPVGYPIGAVTDADADGRPDFLHDSFFVTSHECGLYPTFVHGVPLLVHSLPDGTFTMGDETARRWARLQCLDTPPKVSSADPTVASCKRLWGRSVEEITRGLSSAPDSCGGAAERELTRRLVAPPPPFATLDRKTPAPLPRTRPKE